MNILVVSAHPDDEILGCGGLIYKLGNSGAIVNIIFLTNGGSSKYLLTQQANISKILNCNYNNIAILDNLPMGLIKLYSINNNIDSINIPIPPPLLPLPPLPQ